MSTSRHHQAEECESTSIADVSCQGQLDRDKDSRKKALSTPVGVFHDCKSNLATEVGQVAAVLVVDEASG